MLTWENDFYVQVKADGVFRKTCDEKICLCEIERSKISKLRLKNQVISYNRSVTIVPAQPKRVELSYSEVGFVCGCVWGNDSIFVIRNVV